MVGGVGNLIEVSIVSLVGWRFGNVIKEDRLDLKRLWNIEFFNFVLVCDKIYWVLSKMLMWQTLVEWCKPRVLHYIHIKFVLKRKKTKSATTLQPQPNLMGTILLICHIISIFSFKQRKTKYYKLWHSLKAQRSHGKK